MNPPKNFSTADLYLTSYLRSYDILPQDKYIEESDSNKNKRTFWIYTDSKELRERVYAYQHDEWIKKFIKAIRDQKYQIFNPSELIF